MRLSKITKMIARSALESFQKRDLETQKQLLVKWKRHYENNEGDYSEDGRRALKLVVRVLA